MEIQQAIDAALAEKDKRIVELEALCKKYQADTLGFVKRIAELEDALGAAGMLERSHVACEQIIHEQRERIETISKLWNTSEQRLASLQALMEQMPHDKAWVQSSGTIAVDCLPGCHRCAYQKLLEEWK